MKKLIAITIGVLVVSTGCQDQTQDVEWGYEQDNGPDKWSTISSDYQLCESGQQQSPIDLETKDISTGSESFELNYTDTIFNIVDTGHSLEFEDKSSENTITYNDQDYSLQQIHFHNESENTINGQSYPLEAHFVHTNDTADNLVISVMFELGDENAVIGNSFTKVGSKIEFNPEALIPTNGSYYTFVGSLTTPPCTEGVQWLVFEQPLSISEQQLEDFTRHYENNNRNIQPLNGRDVEFV